MWWQGLIIGKQHENKHGIVIHWKPQSVITLHTTRQFYSVERTVQVEPPPSANFVIGLVLKGNSRVSPCDLLTYTSALGASKRNLFKCRSSLHPFILDSASSGFSVAVVWKVIPAVLGFEVGCACFEFPYPGVCLFSWKNFTSILIVLFVKPGIGYLSSSKTDKPE